MSVVKNENFYVIHGWMLNELNLKGNELLVYAIIYGFSQAENQSFTGSLTYLSEFTGATKQTAINTINSLIKKGLIDKAEKNCNGVKFCEYQSKNFRGGQKILMGSQNFLTGVVKNFDWGSQKILPNNIEYNIEDNIEDNIDSCAFAEGKSETEFEKQKSKSKTKTDYIPDWFDEVWRMYPRKKGKSSVTKDAFKAISKAGKETIIRAIQNYYSEIKKNHTAEQYILHGSTFFNGRWQDYVNQDDSQAQERSEPKHDERYGKIV